MKYGVLSYKPDKERRTWKHNLGDFIQVLAIKNLYSRMNIDKKDIVSVNLFRMNEYEGDYCILPINCYNSPNIDGKTYFPPSPKIIPVYTSFHFNSQYIDEETLQSLRNYQPIGCRDEVTLQIMRRYGIIAYLTGCVTATLPRRQNIPKEKKVFIVDVPDELMEFIPKELLENAQFHTQLISDSKMPDEARIIELSTMAEDIIKKLKEEATLVITRRMHIASPCVAMGIPVILARNYFDTRYAWIEKLIHPYEITEYGDIDWNPQPINYEDEKQMLLNMYTNELQKAAERSEELCRISTYFEDRKRSKYNENYVNLLKGIKSEYGNDVKIIIWGIYIHAAYLFELIPQYFGDYEIVVIDSYIEGTYENLTIRKPEYIKGINGKAVCIVTAPSIQIFAQELVKDTQVKIIALDCYDK